MNTALRTSLAVRKYTAYGEMKINTANNICSCIGCIVYKFSLKFKLWEVKAHQIDCLALAFLVVLARVQEQFPDLLLDYIQLRRLHLLEKR